MQVNIDACSGGWRLLLRLASLALLLAGNARADAPSVRAPVPSEEAQALPDAYGLVVALPGATTDLAEIALERPPQSLRINADTPLSWIQLEDPRIQHPLRRKLLEQAARNGQAGQMPACTLDVPQLKTVVGQLEDALDFQDVAAATSALARVDAAFSCDQEAAPPELLGRLLFLSGVLDLYSHHADRGQFVLAARIVPDLPIAADYAPAIQKAFQRAKESLPSRPLVKVRAQEDLAGMTLMIDGRPPPGEFVELLEGLHFVQLSDPGGRVLAASPMTIVAPSTPSERASLMLGGELPPRVLQPLTLEQLEVRVREAARIGRVDPELEAAIGSVLRAGNHPWLLVLTPVNGRLPARALWVLPGGEVVAQDLRSGASTAGIALTGGLGTLSIASFGALGWFISLAADDYHTATDEGAERLNMAANLTSVVAPVALTATLLVGSRTFRVPDRFYHRHHGLKEGPGKAAPGLTLNLTGSGVEVRW